MKSGRAAPAERTMIERNCFRNRKYTHQHVHRISNPITCGTHFGETKLVASTIGNPEETSIFINSTLTEVGIMCFSFCSPSLGPTSTIFTNCGILHKYWESRNNNSSNNSIIGNNNYNRKQHCKKLQLQIFKKK